MKILITGATGFIGAHLVKQIGEHDITILSRDPASASQLLGTAVTAIGSLSHFDNLDDFDAVINLAGEPIINKRWSKAQKGRICRSRWDITATLVEKMEAGSQPPATFISGSAVGIYGNQHDLEITEDFDVSGSVDPDDFAYQVCRRWEQLAVSASSPATRVCLLRTGIVLGRNGGALKKMLPPYQLGAGGPIGNGRQYFPWIHIDDMVAAILFLLNTPEAKGPFNLTAPEPVTNRTFSRSLAAALHRPHILFTPAFVLKLALGEASSLLLEGQRALPEKLESLGFTFRFRQIDAALADLLA
ncbi:epimerase [Photobacterium aquae]|uniref:Epimerase n=1 Tax=Photobacterium aquae TaxID=1195763 RepID=A0A0J1HCE9_9GAMM|nr:TIGR01777 family oxidoreductase [Photobacterium aquae]KLV09301.1 epimerase [Photobacterium aquae]